MPRRPRPAHRGGPIQEKEKKEKKKIKEPKISVVQEVESSEGEEKSQEELEEGNLPGHEEAFEEDSEDDDADAPRVVQWVGDSDLEANEESEEEEEDEGGPSRLKNIQSDLSGLPLGALRRAQNMLKETEETSSSEEESGSDDDSEEDGSGSDDEKKEEPKREWSTKKRTDIEKRRNKHAPIEVTSKRPVTRRRTVVEVKKVEARDPRFMATTGEFSAEKFQQNYGFLVESHKTELSTLRENLKRARKLLSNSPKELREERAYEVQRLELAVKRAESLVNRDKLERVQQEALQKVAREEREKRKQGKGEWYMKPQEKRELVVKARYEALAAEGGKRAVKRAIEKKQKKVSQKEKRSRPYPKGGVAEEGRKRGFAGEGQGRDGKRRRVG